MIDVFVLIILTVVVLPLILVSVHKTVEIADNLRVVHKANKSFKKSIRNTTLIIMPFKINNKIYNFIIDTGASMSMINECIIEELNAELLEKGKPAYGIDGEIKESKATRLNLEYEGKSYNCLFNVQNVTPFVKNVKDETGVEVAGLIGNNFLMQHECCIDFMNQKIMF